MELYYYVHASLGWGVQIRNLSISRIRSLSVRKRMFCVFDRDKPYTLSILYEPLKVIVIAPQRIIGLNGIVCRRILSTGNDPRVEITYRYNSISAINAEIKNIQNKQRANNNKQ